MCFGRLDDVSTHDESVPDWGTETVVDMIFRSAAITGDRFENTGELFSKNASYGECSQAAGEKIRACEKTFVFLHAL